VIYEGRVYTKIRRPDPDVVQALESFSVATLQEAVSGAGLLDPIFTPLLGADSPRPLVGPALTALNHDGDNLATHRVLPLAQPGDVLVLSNRGEPTGAIWGEIVTISAQAAGAVGAVVSGAIRDAAAIRELGFPVWYRAINARNAVKETLGGVNIPMVVGGVLVRPGDLVAADEDGVLVIPAEVAPGAVERARAHEEKEAALRARVAAGEFIYDFAGYRERLERHGIEELEEVCPL
jgi:4-hydroxy-4-methyl-2-oxoglutarate aldolase